MVLNGPKLIFKHIFGRVYFGYDSWSPQGGMNDQGLFFDFFATKPLEVKLSKEKPKFQGPMIDTMLAECATVEEVLDMFGQYNLEWMSKLQMFLVDKTGVRANGTNRAASSTRWPNR